MIDVITNEQAERVQLILGGIKGAPEKAFVGIINRTMTTVRSQSSRHVRAAYHIKQSDLNSNQHMQMRRATASNLAGEIEFAGNMVPLIKFKVSPKSPEQRSVSVAVLKKNGGKRLENAYVTDLGRYGVGVFERLTRRRNTSQQLFGPSPAHMMENENVLDKVQGAARDTASKRVEQEISRILNGYGG